MLIGRTMENKVAQGGLRKKRGRHRHGKSLKATSAAADGKKPGKNHAGKKHKVNEKVNKKERMPRSKKMEYSENSG